MDWYEQFFEGDWLDLQRAHANEERDASIAEALMQRLDLRPGNEVLDVPCGNGRIAVALARRGVHMTGVDRTAPLLEEARLGASELDVPSEWHCLDMRALPWERRFRAVINYWSSIGYFDEQGEAMFAGALFRALEPGGALLVETVALETLVAHWQARGWSEIAGMKVLEERSVDWRTGRVRTEWTFLRDDRVSSRRSSDLKVYACAELVALLRGAGFADFEVGADVAGAPFGPGRRLVLVARRPA